MKQFLQQKALIPIIYSVAYCVGAVHGIYDSIRGRK